MSTTNSAAVRPTSTSANGAWHRNTKRGFLLDFQMPDSFDQMVIGQPPNLRNLDPELIVRQLADSGVAALYTHALDNQGNCYYDTVVGHKHTDIGERDLMADLSRECRTHDMKILFYVQLSRQRRSFGFEKHQARREDGSPVLLTDTTPRLPSYEERPVACLNGPHRDYILAIARELATNYDFDGFWFDCFGWWGRVVCCYCDTCRAKYVEDTGRDLPTGERQATDEWRTYLCWRYRINTLVWREITEAVRAINPALTITHNGASAIWADLDFYDFDDYVSSEFHYNEGHGALSLQCRKSRALKEGSPFEIEIWRFFRPSNHTLRGYQVRPLPMHLVEMSSVTAHGGLVQYYDQINPDGTLDGRSLEGLTAAFESVRLREPWLSGGSPIAHAAVVWSQATRAFAHPDQAAIHERGLEGAHHALMEDHLPLHVLTDHQVAHGEFGGAKVVILPNVACLSDEQVDRLDQFVQRGGGLVATYRTSLCDELGRPRADFALANLFGVEYLEPMSYLHSFVQPSVSHPVTEGLRLDWPMTLWKLPQVKVNLVDAQSVGQVVNPMRGFHMGHPPMEVTPFPAIAVREHGAGRVVYFSAPIDAVYGDYGHPDYRQMLTNAARWAAGATPRIEVDGPLSLEVVAYENDADGQMVVHLLNRAAVGGARAKGSVIQEIVPVHNVTIRINGAVEYARAAVQPSGQDLDVTNRAKQGVFEVTVPQVDYHEILVLTR